MKKYPFFRIKSIDYKQSPPDFLSTKEQPFDLQCQIEIERIEKQEIHNQKIKEKKNAPALEKNSLSMATSKSSAIFILK
jgi:hypothetical protein